jgi:hypothetical protein
MEKADHEARKRLLFDASKGKLTDLTVGQFARWQKTYGISTQKLINND